MADTIEQKKVQEEHMEKLEKLASQASLEFVASLTGLIAVAQRPSKTKEEAEKAIYTAASEVLRAYVGATQNIAIYVATQLIDHMNDSLNQVGKEEK